MKLRRVPGIDANGWVTDQCEIVLVQLVRFGSNEPFGRDQSGDQQHGREQRHQKPAQAADCDDHITHGVGCGWSGFSYDINNGPKCNNV